MKLGRGPAWGEGPEGPRPILVSRMFRSCTTWLYEQTTRSFDNKKYFYKSKIAIRHVTIPCARLHTWTYKSHRQSNNRKIILRTRSVNKHDRVTLKQVSEYSYKNSVEIGVSDLYSSQQENAFLFLILARSVCQVLSCDECTSFMPVICLPSRLVD